MFAQEVAMKRCARPRVVGVIIGILVAWSAPLEASEFIPGDANDDGSPNIADAVFILMYLFNDGPAPRCARGGDANGDTGTDISDPVFLLAHFFGSGPPPPPADCGAAIDCAGNPWIIDCVGHWECDCGECRSVCDSTTCGDGKCDREGGETAASCSVDCTEPCTVECRYIGSFSEGWYDTCTGKLIRYALCAECVPECRACGSKSEGWYDSCDDSLILYAKCECQ
jgi:hypothetical protein